MCIYRDCRAQITIDKDNNLKALMKKDDENIAYK